MAEQIGKQLADREIASRRRAGGDLECDTLWRFDTLRDARGCRRKQSERGNTACHETQKCNMSLRSHELTYTTLNAAGIGPIAAFDEMTGANLRWCLSVC
jgi:hypothetical protein